MEYQTKEQRREIYKRLLDEVNVSHVASGTTAICIKLYPIAFGELPEQFNEEYQDKVLRLFPEFKIAYDKHKIPYSRIIEQCHRPAALRLAIELTEKP